LVIPWFNDVRDADVFANFRSRPRLAGPGGWVTGVSETRWDFSRSGKHYRFSTTEATENAWCVLMARHIQLGRIDFRPAFNRYISLSEDLVDLNNGIVVEGPDIGLDGSHPFIVYRYPSRN